MVSSLCINKVNNTTIKILHSHRDNRQYKQSLATIQKHYLFIIFLLKADSLLIRAFATKNIFIYDYQ